jgi:phosphatidylinositol alpha-1,6-mannosyltransferase
MGPIFVYSTIAFAGIAGLINPKWGLGAYLFLLYLQPEWNWRCVRQHHVNAIHAGRPLHEGLVARWMNIRYGIPYLCFIHGEDINVATTSRELKVLTHSVLRNAYRLVANSNFTVGLLRNDWQVPEEKFALMHPGIDVSQFSDLDRDPGARKYTAAGDVVLLTVGRLQKRKGQDAVIRSVAKLRDKHPNLRYLIAGLGE